jgi:hypothetical protein
LEALPIVNPGARIRLNCDNTTAVAYVNNMGGRIKRLDRVATRIWELLERGQAYMTAVYVPTDENPADALTRGVTSRKRMLDTEVQINPRIIREIVHSGPFLPQIDWFASDVNAQFPRFYVWQPQTRTAAEGVNAFLFHWGNTPGYMFPPFALLPRIIRKIRDDKAKVLLIHPRWPGALWAPSLPQMTLRRQELEQSTDVLRYPHHPNLRHPMTDLRLVASWLDGALTTAAPGRR